MVEIRRKHSKRTYRSRKKRKYGTSLSLSKLSQKVKMLDSRTRNKVYKFQLKGEYTVNLSQAGAPTVFSLTNFNSMRPIFEARKDDGTINDHLNMANKVKAGISGINYAISINDVVTPVFSVSIFIVKLKKTAKRMVDNAGSGVFEGVDMVPEKDYCLTPESTEVGTAQFVMLSKNLFRILYHRRHVMGRKITPNAPATGTGADKISSVSNRRDTNVDKYFKLRHDKTYRAPYGNGWLATIGRQEFQPIAGRAYIIIVPQMLTGDPLPDPPVAETGRIGVRIQQVCTLTALD